MNAGRVMGTETEYAIADPQDPGADPRTLALRLVRAAAQSDLAHIRWDYGNEDPVNDARGGRLPRSAAAPSMLTDAPGARLIDVAAPNGARIYVDHAHPEYASAETVNAFDALVQDRAGDRIMALAAERAGGLALYKNNVDGKGAAWGSHENYLMDRAVPFARVAALMTIHFVTRQIYTGSGRVGLGPRSEEAGFQLSQRADYLTSRIGLQTTFGRPIINTRDESHAGPGSRRLHVIVGDANRLDAPLVLKLGTTDLLLALLESEGDSTSLVDGLLDRWTLDDPVSALHTVSRDVTLTKPLALANGGFSDALTIQGALLDAVRKAGRDADRPGCAHDRVLNLWGQALEDLALVRSCDDEGRLAMHDQAGRLEWLLKWQLLERLRRRRSLSDWSDPRLAALDLAWARVDPGRDLPWRLRGSVLQLANPDQITRAMDQGPEQTRAWCRSQLLHRCPDVVRAVSWSRVILDEQGPEGESRTRVVDLSDPLGHTRSSCRDGRDIYCS